jgi:hypothetical protein
MNKAIAFLNIGGSSLHPKSQASFEHAAKRWGADLVEIKEQIEPGVHHFWQKSFVINELAAYDQVLQLDADMLIHRDAPSPFDLVPVEAMGFVSARQYIKPGLIVSRERSTKLWANRLGMKPPQDLKHINAGLWLYSPKHHQDIFEKLRAIGRAHHFTPKNIPEQASMSVLVANQTDHPVVWLPRSFNVLDVRHEARGDRAYKEMFGWIYHFTGQANRKKRIDEVWWNHDQWMPPFERHNNAIAKRIPGDGSGFFGAEVGVQRGRNAASLLIRKPGLSLYLVDQWKRQGEESSYMKSKDWNSQWLDDDYGMIFKECLHYLDNCHGRYRILQGDSVQMANAIEDESLDFVFVDADHSKEGCLRDIRAYLPKIRRGPNAWIGGHDYGVKWGGAWGVREAVLECFSEKDVELDAGKTWFVRLP